MFNLCTGSDGAFTRVPESTTLIPGKLLRLNCGIDSTDPVLWRFTAEGSASSTDMTSIGILLPAFRRYFYIDATNYPTSLYDLVAQTSNANESYCGTYACSEHRSSGDTRTATVASKCTKYIHVCICLHSTSKNISTYNNNFDNRWTSCIAGLSTRLTRLQPRAPDFLGAPVLCSD